MLRPEELPPIPSRLRDMMEAIESDIAKLVRIVCVEEGVPIAKLELYIPNYFEEGRVVPAEVLFEKGVIRAKWPPNLPAIIEALYYWCQWWEKGPEAVRDRYKEWLEIRSKPYFLDGFSTWGEEKTEDAVIFATRVKRRHYEFWKKIDTEISEANKMFIDWFWKKVLGGKWP